MTTEFWGDAKGFLDDLDEFEQNKEDLDDGVRDELYLIQYLWR